MKIEYTSSPHTADIDFLTQKINEETPEFGAAHPFAFFIRENEKIIAGANGSVIFGAIYTDQLWVAPHYRKQGLGIRLMERIEEYGREQKCLMATVSTMSFQGAREFYENLGYKMDFERHGYIRHTSFLFLKKKLS
jgi:GNAT superfamily N-acetyltransferase